VISDRFPENQSKMMRRVEGAFSDES
jgi:hypothetical protein